MKRALVVHPQISYYAGAELLCLYTCETLQRAGYHVTLACDVFNPADVDRHFGLGNVVQKCTHKKISQFSPIIPYFVSLQKIIYAIRMRTLLSRTDAEVVFSTQSSSFYIPKKKLFHVAYNAFDLFNYPLGSNLLGLNGSKQPMRRPYRSLLRKVRKFFLDRYSPKPTAFLAVGSRVLRELTQRGYNNSTLLLPPCRTIFQPKFPKKKQVVQFARIIPDKRLELFIEIALRLPQYPFYIVGRPPELPNYEYFNKILLRLPRNVTYVNALTAERADLLEHSKVYLYTGIESGIGIALIESISAGCIPFSPPEVGAADVIEMSGTGHIYDSVEQAAEKIATVMETEQSVEETYEVSAKARMFSPESFRKRIGELVG
jgi:glycosyltransferase involved in cell wall biosynthesis